MLVIIAFIIIIIILSSRKTYYLPSHIIIIRHGEKSKRHPNNHLDHQGKDRAVKLPLWLHNNIHKLTGKNINNVAAIYTPLPRNNGGDFRPRQTVELTSFRYNIPLYGTKYSFQTDEASDEILSNPQWQGKVLLVCWEHTCIQKLMGDLMEKINGHRIMMPYWEGKDFSTVFVIDTKNGKVMRSCQDIFKNDRMNCELSNKIKTQTCKGN
jgi:hypothetical protein